MSKKIYPVTAKWQGRAYVDRAKYEELYARSVADPEAFWAQEAKRIDWIKPFTKVKDTSFGPASVFIRWFEDGTTNATLNCIDRHLPRCKNRIAI
ncbi:MAG TPA: acetyl-coenzyme A synthetase N-terminal domain-containing protein, partial [Methylocella sp.]|nr:acetyl-coenzyme A synthetase N-terminal domain-containing protein [Methylocella sp.]